MTSPFTTQLRSALENPEEILTQLQKGKSFQKIADIELEYLATLYRKAFQLFEEHRYLEAADGFLFLAALDGSNHDYWLGLGMAEQMGGHYEAAIDAYELAAIAEIDNPVPYFYLAKCLFAIHDRSSAGQALDMAIEYSIDIPKYEELHRQAVAAKKLLDEAE